MRPVASLFTKFSENFFFGKHQYSFQTGSRSCQVSNGIKGSIATDYAGLGLDCTGVPDISFPFFTQSAEEPISFHRKVKLRQIVHFSSRFDSPRVKMNLLPLFSSRRIKNF